MILQLSLLAILGNAYQLLKKIELEVINNFSEKLSLETNDEDLLLVFYFEKASYPLAIVSHEKVREADFNITTKPKFIESRKEIYFDFESMQTRHNIHLIEISQGNDIYYYVRDGFGPFRVKLEVYSKPHSTCINNCQGYSLNKIIQNASCTSKCECQSGFFGSYCQFELQKMEKDVQYEIQLMARKIIYLSYQFNEQALLIAEGVNEPITVSFGILGLKGYEVPDSTSYTAILHSQLSLTKLMQNLHQQFQNSTTLVIGLQCKSNQSFKLYVKQEQIPKIWDGNCLFLIFASFNIFIIIICFAITNLCKKKDIKMNKKKIKVRPPPIEENPKNFSGQFFDKYFEIFDYEDFIKSNPEFQQNTQCVVCLDNLNQKEISVSICGHIFHHLCLKKWLMKVLTCPSCRQQITYQQVIQGGWIGSKLSQSPLHPQSNPKCKLVNDSNILIESMDNIEIVDKQDNDENQDS
ncbi:unnamed protein product (macronuclear) [Paramecium tetraurelia]|uniref:Chromosome undetermined scaffold_1, whole genome shotgun sequence n=1 Tax=Paramecium tetraurelia TaxID=5888 RepID=Q6BGA3_PARTE|nr:RNA-binding Zn finger [Paramecium tetraurelia strain d4-2]XP_001423383.1 uncharacterized protein GSPATT00000420001 [Paramecium tetraurelia]CAH03317.1 RNA-binding Zn finger, putative [Paramecium tetraurelia]CAK55985.1 unnamed protein product [Paramecium tetraurelia]|eukprot:XP_001423383.1 hypothetical protein (macronuclear) [Paramecium tetraurelia strain d4-2]